jgi:glutamine synthetase
MSEDEQKRLGIAQLPGDLDDAIREVEGSELVKNTLGDHVFEKFIENKKIEWKQYRERVTEFELDRYLPVL